MATIYESYILINQSSTIKKDSQSSSMSPNFIKVKHQFELHPVSTIDSNNSRIETRINTENSNNSKLGKRFCVHSISFEYLNIKCFVFSQVYLNSYY